MAKLHSGRIGTSVWTVDPLLSRTNSMGTHGVDNPAFYDTELNPPKKKPDGDDDDDVSYSKKQCNGRLLIVATLLLLMVLIAMIGTVIYLAVGEVRLTWDEENELQESEDGMSLVVGEIRITNRVFTKDLLHSGNSVYHRLSIQVQQSMDAVFFNYLPHYNETRVLGYSEGSVIARCLIHFKKPGTNIQREVGLAVIQALERHHGYLPGGLLQVDIRSLKFTGVPDGEAIEIPAEETPDESTDCGGKCKDGEVCILLPQTPLSRCLVPRDANDPSGCGGWCVSEHQLCKKLGNFTYQCIDNVANCKKGEWQCSNGLCIAASGRCNGRIECYDMSDEIDCECGAGQFRCGTPCIPDYLRCDGKTDCWDASDEVNCTKSCGSEKFTCNDGKCVDMILFCDRYPDCPDGSDEPEGCNESCLPTQKQCNSGRCIHLDLWCNGDNNCGDGSDETDCPTSPPGIVSNITTS
ncbi:low-density lipoprotein receptor-related protein 2 [Parasteatoda tepidariorum]|uniref:low-density lipoprotein receptor-related protein 2 n=1 Tax=Parasteatoda tepidariorum TaxID=114398 RepID=UPI001C7213AF|nr:low-density lipoprotein receptor-related protein 1B isoform X1 [Parasteatoda tepidariorum]